ncbi:MAG: ATP-binding protein [Actinomycetota bacterium]
MSRTERLARFFLKIPSAEEHVRTSRIFGASIARHFRCDEESVEDLKLALSEAVSRAFGMLPDASQAPVRVVAQATGDRLAFRIEHDGLLRGETTEALPEGGESLEDQLPAEIGEDLIRALFPDATFLETADGASITRFSMPLEG